MKFPEQSPSSEPIKSIKTVEQFACNIVQSLYGVCAIWVRHSEGPLFRKEDKPWFKWRTITFDATSLFRNTGPSEQQADTVCVKKCATQYDLAVHNGLLTKRSPKTLRAHWHIFNEHKLLDVYEQLAKLLKIAVTLPIILASAERVHSKLKLAGYNCSSFYV